MNKSLFKPYWVLTIAVILVISSFILVNLSSPYYSTDFLQKRVQKTFDSKISQTKEYISKLKNNHEAKTVLLTEDPIEKGISLFVYKEGELVFWSDNTTPVNLNQEEIIYRDSLIQLGYKKYYIIQEADSVFNYLGLIHMENDFPYENKYLLNGLNPDFKMPYGQVSSFDSTKNQIPILNDFGEIVLYLNMDFGSQKENIPVKAMATMLLLLGIGLLLCFLKCYLQLLGRDKLNTALILTFPGLILTRILMININVVDDRFLFFDPFIYATRIAPSFGDLIVNTFVFLFLSYLVIKYVRVPERYINNDFNRRAWIGILNVVFIASLFYAQNISRGIINHSNIPIIAFNISQISYTSFIAYILIGINFLGVSIIAFWVVRNLESEKKYLLIINCALILVIVSLFGFAFNLNFDFYTVCFGIVLYSIITYAKESFGSSKVFNTLIFILFAFSLYIVLFSYSFSSKKEFQQNKSYAISLSNEHDLVAEYLFEDLSRQIIQDSVIKGFVEQPTIINYEINNYLIKKYFTGYWKKYDIYITVCDPTDSIVDSYQNEGLTHCYDFYSDIIDLFGRELSEFFYYMDTYDQGISYLGLLPYYSKNDDEQQVTLFLELFSKLETKSFGYPELLLDERIQKEDRLDQISYAKYYMHELISNNGDYDYSLKSVAFEKDGNQEFYKLRHNGYDHMVYRPDEESIIVVSQPSWGAIDLVILFSYAFVFYYLTTLFIAFILTKRYSQLSFRNNFRNKIQISIMGILIASLLLIAGSTIWFFVSNYNQTQNRIIKEKIQSVNIELENELSGESRLSNNWSYGQYDNLNQLLQKFSNVFYSDINLYDPDGNLLATSRDQIFQLGLQNNKMDPMAYNKLHDELLASYVHREKINKLTYLSAYIPFVNESRKLLGYLNLPYFTKQRELQDEITTLSVTIINIYVLLILLTIIIAVLISNQITRPLEMIQSKFKNLKVGGRYEKINYGRSDEVGRLVNEYNTMVIELQESIELLAKSERESAWREMAKQIAHEIKNPLTPMRLSVQQLQRAWDDKKESFESYLKRVTVTLIEQIDNLTTISDEFSNFAKMPVANIRPVNITDVAEKSVQLFRGNENITITISSLTDKMIVMADSEQLNRVFINIIKNGIQSIPEGKDGKIEIKLYIERQNAIVEFKDNGKGIPDDITSKLFMPNFTTKTSGMGLGLAIVKNIIAQLKGEITFKTKLGEGTVFRMQIPLKEANK